MTPDGRRPTPAMHQRKGSIGLSLLSRPLLLLRLKPPLPTDPLVFVSARARARPGAEGRESTRIRLASRDAAAEFVVVVAPYRPARRGLVCEEGWEEREKSSSSQLTVRRRPRDSGDAFGWCSRSRCWSRSRSRSRFGRMKSSSRGEEPIRSTRWWAGPRVETLAMTGGWRKTREDHERVSGRLGHWAVRRTCAPVRGRSRRGSRRCACCAAHGTRPSRSHWSPCRPEWPASGVRGVGGCP